MKNELNGPFSEQQILNVNEIGAPSSNVEEMNSFLEQHTGSKFWTGDRYRFGTNGDEHGMFLLLNNKIKDSWFPTDIYPESAPFEIVVEVDGRETNLSFAEGKFYKK